MSEEPSFDPPREKCNRCGGPNPPWHAPSPLWNAVMRGGSINGEPIYGDMVCATCFMVIAEEQGVATIWRVQALRVNVPLETVTPSGRVWNPDTFLWESRSSPTGRGKGLKIPHGLSSSLRGGTND